MAADPRGSNIPQWAACGIDGGRDRDGIAVAASTAQKQRPFSDKGKPIVRWGRKATGQG